MSRSEQASTSSYTVQWFMILKALAYAGSACAAQSGPVQDVQRWCAKCLQGKKSMHVMLYSTQQGCTCTAA